MWIYKKKVKEYMTFPLITVQYSTTIKEALNFMTDKHFKRLIIADGQGNAIGHITQEDLLAKIYSRWATIMKSSQVELEELNRMLNEKASEYELMSVTDPLTSIYNRSKFELELKKEINRVTRYRTDYFSVVFFDIDNFKKINDTYGHITGDRVLKSVTQVLKESLRLTDLFARWGGEEFAVIMSHTSLADATVAAEKLRKTIELTHIEDVGCVTCSFGVYEFSQGDTVQSVMLKVDNLMYEAKKNGKNRVETALT
jgi:diguanylate cyclase (GGDEF)-like protein